MREPMLLPGDILMFRGKGFMSKAIRKMTKSRGEEKTLVNHVGQVVSKGGFYITPFVEARWRVKISVMDDYADTGDKIAVARPINISDEDLLLISTRALEYVKRRYGSLKLVLHAADYCLGGRYVFRRIGRLDKYPICSYLVAKTYSEAGYHFGVSPYAAQPDDIWDFVINSPDKYDIVRGLEEV